MSFKVYIGAFVVVAVVVAAARLDIRRSAIDTKPVVAVIDVHEPGLVDRSLWMNVEALAKVNMLPAVDEHQTSLGDGGTRVFLCARAQAGSDRATIVNTIAQSFADACRLQFKTLAQRRSAAAQQIADLADRQVNQCERLLEQTKAERLPSTVAVQAPPQAPAMVDNPQWMVCAQRVDDLESQLRQLLGDRTELHPSVQQLKARIEQARQTLARIPQKLVSDAPQTPQPQMVVHEASGPNLLELAKREKDLNQARQSREVAQAQWRTALAASNRSPRIDIERAVAAAPPTFSAAQLLTIQCFTGQNVAVLGLAFVAGLAVVLALAAFSSSAALEKIVCDVDTLRKLVPAPVLGIVPANSKSGSSRWNNKARQLLRAALAVAATVSLAFAAATGWAR